MRGVVSETRVPVTVFYIKVLYQDYCVIHICYVLSENLEGSLIAI